MEKCEYYKVKEFEEPICTNHKYYFECDCGGDRKKCDYFLAIREEARQQEKENKYMNTAEMYLQAKKDGKYYKTSFIAYQKDKGLFDDCFNNYGDLSAWNFDDFMELNWEVWENIMTKSEAEAKFNIKIVGD